MGGKVLAGIFERMAKNMRYVRSGVPDLVVWNTETKQFKVSRFFQIQIFEANWQLPNFFYKLFFFTGRTF